MSMLKKVSPPGIAALGIVAIIAAPLFLEVGLPGVVLLCPLVGFLLIVLGLVSEVVQRRGKPRS